MNPNNFYPNGYQTYPSNQPMQIPTQYQPSPSNQYYPMQVQNNYQPMNYPNSYQPNIQPHYPSNHYQPSYPNIQSNPQPYYPPTQQQHQQQPIYAPTESLKVNLGPVIGSVTHHTARILVEFNKVEQVTCFLHSPYGETIACKLISQANMPVVFKFHSLRPKTEYKVTLSCALPVESSSFWTIRENHDNPGNLKAAIVSCNDISRQYSKTKDKDLWGHLGGQVRNHALDYVFHIGDQVYMDMALNNKMKYLYGECRAILEATSRDQWGYKRAELLNILRQQYYKTWNHPSEAYVLANVPNLMVGDDHEFRDDWGWNPDDYTPGTIDHFYGELVRQLYYEYQRQLREDIPWDNLASLRCEYHHHILNGVGVSFMEYRGCRSWFREANLKETHIGASQREWLRALYGKGGLFEQVNSAIFISPLPLFIFSKLVSKVAFLKVDDVQEYWTYQSIPQLLELLDLIRGWKQRRSDRDLVIVGGDIHLGGTTDVMYAGQKLCTQFVCSAINSHESHWLEKGIMDLVMKWGKVNSDYTFMHRKWTKRNNYGVVEVYSDYNGSRIDCKLEKLKPQKQNSFLGKILGK